MVREPTVTALATDEPDTGGGKLLPHLVEHPQGDRVDGENVSEIQDEVLAIGGLLHQLADDRLEG